MKRLIYTFLLLCRLLSCFQTGYIHPDEFFQGGQELFFGCSGAPGSKLATREVMFSTKQYASLFGNFQSITAPWEFQYDNALRSIVPPSIMTLFPLWLYSKISMKGCNLGQNTCFTGDEILLVPRIFTAIMSTICIDGSVYYISRLFNKSNSSDSWLILNILASSWVALVFFCRPFTNTLETICLAVLCSLASRDIQQHNSVQDNVLVLVLIGVILALGVFTRFTFVFYALPVVLMLFYSRLHQLNVSERLRKALVAGTIMAGSFVCMSAVFICLDTSFYRNQIVGLTAFTRSDVLHEYIITPWNAFLYNSSSENLKNHGLHPRYTHALINLPLLFGPLTIRLYWLLSSGTSKLGNSILHRMMISILLFGMCALSLAPHQEPRFLLPLIIPLVTLVIGKGHKSICFIICWFFFNSSLVFFFGFFHQGAVLGSLKYLRTLNDTSELKSIIYFRTYMPPTFLLLNIPQYENEGVFQPVSLDETHHSALLSTKCNKFPVIDLGGSDLETLSLFLRNELDCSKGDVSHNVIVVGPQSSMYDLDEMNTIKICQNMKEYECNEIWSSKQYSSEEFLHISSIPNSMLCSIVIRCPSP